MRPISNPQLFEISPRTGSGADSETGTGKKKVWIKTQRPMDLQKFSGRWKSDAGADVLVVGWEERLTGHASRFTSVMTGEQELLG